MIGFIGGSIMCEHEESLYSGEYVCVKCGLVTGTEYVYDRQNLNLSNKKGKNRVTCKYLWHFR